MVEVGYTGGKSQQHMSWAQIQQMRKKMKRSFKQLPKIKKVAEKTAKKDEDIAEKNLQAFLNS